MHAAIQKYVDANILAGVSSVILKDNRIVDFRTWGHADIESEKPIEDDTIFRIYSNTKIITTVAAMCLFEDGCFKLDDPIDNYLPALADLSVLKAGAEDASEVEPAATRPTVRQVMCHNAGFSYGLFQESKVDPLYAQRDVMSAKGTLADMVEKLGEIPLAYQPGARWQYSVSTDILARLVEVWSGKSFFDFLYTRIFKPLTMMDTDFYVPESKHGRFATNYVPVNPMQPMEGGLNPAPDTLIGGYLSPKSFTSGGGGLVSTIGDYTSFIQMLIGEGEFGGERILKPETVAMMHQSQLPQGVGVVLPTWPMPDTTFGLGVAIKTAPAKGEPESATDEYHWGGMAGTHSWISPRANLAGLVFTQRLPGFWHPFSHEFKRLVYQAAS